MGFAGATPTESSTHSSSRLRVIRLRRVRIARSREQLPTAIATTVDPPRCSNEQRDNSARRCAHGVNDGRPQHFEQYWRQGSKRKNPREA